MLKIVIIIVVLVVIVLVIKGSAKSSQPRGRASRNASTRTRSTGTRSTGTRQYSPPRPQPTQTVSNTRTVTRQNFTQKLYSLADNQDVKVQSSNVQQQQLVREARNYTVRKYRTYNSSKETINVDLSWSENLAELLEATEVVYTNAQMNCNRRLISERFDYYINLHYRSFTAADLCYAKREEILPCYIQVKKIVDRLKDRNDPLRVDKESYDQLIQLRNTMGSICALLKDRVSTLNQQTKILKNKIRDECGQRGRDWYNRLEERIRQNSSS